MAADQGGREALNSAHAHCRSNNAFTTLLAGISSCSCLTGLPGYPNKGTEFLEIWCSGTLGMAKLPFPGLENFDTAVAYHFCLILPAAFSQPGNGNLAHPCICV